MKWDWTWLILEKRITGKNKWHYKIRTDRKPWQLSQGSMITLSFQIKVMKKQMEIIIIFFI